MCNDTTLDFLKKCSFCKSSFTMYIPSGLLYGHAYKRCMFTEFNYFWDAEFQIYNYSLSFLFAGMFTNLNVIGRVPWVDVQQSTLRMPFSPAYQPLCSNDARNWNPECSIQLRTAVYPWFDMLRGFRIFSFSQLVMFPDKTVSHYVKITGFKCWHMIDVLFVPS